MNTFTEQQEIEIFRQSYTGDKSSYASVGTVKAYIAPLGETESSTNGLQFGQGHSIIVSDDVDLRDGDRIEFAGFVHGVEGVKTRIGVSIPSYKKAITKRRRKTT